MFFDSDDNHERWSSDDEPGEYTFRWSSLHVLLIVITIAGLVMILSGGDDVVSAAGAKFVCRIISWVDCQASLYSP